MRPRRTQHFNGAEVSSSPDVPLSGAWIVDKYIEPISIEFSPAMEAY
jgi:hypothetical protein